MKLRLIKLTISALIIAISTPLYFWLWIEEMDASLIFLWLAVVCVLMFVWKFKSVDKLGARP